MDDLVRKALLFGVGVTAITKEKAKKFVKELQKKENIDPKEGKKMVRELIAVSGKKAKELVKIVDRHVAGVLAEVAAKSDLKHLEKKLRQKARGAAGRAVKKGKGLARRVVKKGAVRLAKRAAAKVARKGAKAIAKRAAKKIVRKARWRL